MEAKEIKYYPNWKEFFKVQQYAMVASVSLEEFYIHLRDRMRNDDEMEKGNEYYISFKLYWRTKLNEKFYISMG